MSALGAASLATAAAVVGRLDLVAAVLSDLVLSEHSGRLLRMLFSFL
jgi:hypothetical protein